MDPLRHPPKPIYSTNFRLRTLSSLFSCHLLQKLSSEVQICLSNCLYDVFTWVSNLCFQLNSSSWLLFILIPSKPAPILRKWHHCPLTCLNQKPRGPSWAPPPRHSMTQPNPIMSNALTFLESTHFSASSPQPSHWHLSPGWLTP